ncbi:MAG: PTS transporter subunit EIIA [Bacteroidetes bacterium]|jgi:PTS system fructose-specific IIA component|nr:PTS transporter subunit EIIA [Bacteroidota bacterium]
MNSTDTVAIGDLLSEERIHVSLPATSREDVIHMMVQLLEDHPCVTDLEQVREDVIERERMMSTGVGKGLALPHAKTAGVTETIGCFAIMARPIDFDAMDEEPVRLAFMLAGPEASRSKHIKILSHISRLLNRKRLRKRILNCDEAAAVLALFAEEEDAPEPS